MANCGCGQRTGCIEAPFKYDVQLEATFQNSKQTVDIFWIIKYLWTFNTLLAEGNEEK